MSAPSSQHGTPHAIPDATERAQAARTTVDDPTAGRPEVLGATGLVKRYGRVTAVDGADFSLRAGEILAIIGDNGAGKSSLVKCLSGAVQPDEGEMRLDGKVVSFAGPIEARQAGIEIVHQSLAVSPSLDIAANLFLGRERRKKGILGSVFRQLDHKGMRRDAAKQLDDLGVLTVQNMGQAVETLSGGQRQAVAVARAAAFGSRVVIMDEPTAALGVKESNRVLRAHRGRAGPGACPSCSSATTCRTCSRSPTASTSTGWGGARASSPRRATPCRTPSRS